jgi:hypothetical protein
MRTTAMGFQSVKTRLAPMMITARPDYSDAVVETSGIRTQEQWASFRQKAHKLGPGSNEWIDYHALIQQGFEYEELPSAQDLGAIPMAVGQQEDLLALAEERNLDYLDKQRSPDWLQNIKLPSGRVIGNTDIHEVRKEIALYVAETGDAKNANVVLRALNDARTVGSMGVSWEIAEGPQLKYEVPTSQIGNEDPSGYQQWLNRQQDTLSQLQINQQPSLTSNGFINDNPNHYSAFDDVYCQASKGNTAGSTGSIYESPFAGNDGQAAT